ncbi:phage integrase SAM-like domain-containing protein [Hymenobacter sp. B1770]|uniref:phage integrase SAM-like domain-containing protein n=1 Tax=Hymenobacter sp. B1770 TaxID=1718788 RepID=UPI003CF33784
MKPIISNSAVLTLIANGASITPDLARIYTQKRSGHHVTLRVTHARRVLAYLPTGLYVMPDEFNPKTKQLADAFLNETLAAMLSRAGKVVASTLDPAKIKAGWERQRVTLQGESTVETMDSIAEHRSYVELQNMAARLEKELALVHEAMKQMEADNTGLAIGPVTSISERKDFDQALAAFMAETEDKLTLKPRDFQMWQTWKARLKECAQHHHLTLTLLGFNMKFYAKYKAYLMDVRGNKLSTFGAHVKRLKSFLKWAEQNGYTVGTGHKSKAFAIVEEAKTIAYLCDKELDMLWAYKQVKPEHAKQIDLCLFQSLTGLRISDAAKKHHITTLVIDGVAVEYLVGKCKKTGGMYKVPLSLDNRIKQILVGHNHNMAIITEAYYNRTIKEIVAEMYDHHGVSMPTVVVVREDAKGVAVSTETPINLELSTHSNRRSFVSRHINSDEFKHTDVLEMLGSTDMKELQKYIQVDSGALNAKAVANAKTRASKRQ